MQALAAWLVARPQNAVLALAATAALIMVPLLQFVSGVVMILLVLAKGVRVAVLQALVAGALLMVIGALLGVPLQVVPTLMLVLWLPLTLLGALLVTTRSLTLTLQVSVIVTVLLVAAFYVAVSDPVAFWLPILDMLVEFWRQAGMAEQAEALASQREVVAGVATIMVAFSSWTMYVVGCLLGYGLYRQLPGETGDYGRFQDLDFGRVIGITLVAALALGLALDAQWLLNIAVVLLIVFALQGFAVVFWMYRQGVLPVYGLLVVAALVLLPRLNVIVILSLAFVGYADAWFGFRKRMAASR